ncbi:MAG: FAD-binding oxidoreductase [Planctomycetaceae bacterium]
MAETSPPPQAEPAVRADGYVVAGQMSDVPDKSGLAVSVNGMDLALFRHQDGIRCIDAACPHEGASLADGDFSNGVVRCPWHDWAFDVRNGCSLDHPGNDVRTFESKVEDGQVLVKLETNVPSVPAATFGKSPLDAIRKSADSAAASKPVRPVEAELTVLEVIDETPDVKTFRLNNSARQVPFDYPGKFLKVCVTVDGIDVWKSFTISSPPSQSDVLELTIKRNPDGQVTNYLFDHVAAGGRLKIKGAQGGYFFDSQRHAEPLVLVSAGSGITPMLSITRLIQQTGMNRPVTFLHGARTPIDVIRYDECRALAASANWFRYYVSLTKPSANWNGGTGRITSAQVLEQVSDATSARYFLCGPDEFMDEIRSGLMSAGVDTERIHTEQFHAGGSPRLVIV